MRYALGLTVTCALILAAPSDRPAAQTNSQPAALEAAEGPLKLSEKDRAAVIEAAVEAGTHQKTPKEFTPALGATVPSSVFQHAFKPEIVRKMPVLKEYWYAYLDREIVMIDAIKKKAVAIIPLPAKYVASGQTHHGAAEPAQSKGPDGASNTDSVPAYTSPETIR
jgi:hypothetical protein